MNVISSKVRPAMHLFLNLLSLNKTMLTYMEEAATTHGRFRNCDEIY
jgi:hypothetical protein